MFFGYIINLVWECHVGVDTSVAEKTGDRGRPSCISNHTVSVGSVGRRVTNQSCYQYLSVGVGIIESRAHNINIYLFWDTCSVHCSHSWNNCETFCNCRLKFSYRIWLITIQCIHFDSPYLMSRPEEFVLVRAVSVVCC